VVNYRKDQKAAEETVNLILKSGAKALACGADVADEAAVTKLLDFTVQHLGGIDILVCSAGIVTGNISVLQSAAEWEKTLSVNLTGSFLCIRASIPHMIAGRRGSIVCLSSVAAEHGVTGLSSYSASKGGINSLVRCLAVELGRKGIRVNAVAPGLIETEMVSDLPANLVREKIERVAMRRMGQPAEVASVVCFLASDRASYITGEVIGVHGGLGA
jgi:3-oxoacyl-[acyl-carrier protein] reductase